MNKTITLPCCGIRIELVMDDENMVSGKITSELRQPCRICGEVECKQDCPNAEENPEEELSRACENAAMDTIEAIVLAHACAGVDVETPAYIEGIETVVDAIGNDLG